MTTESSAGGECPACSPRSRAWRSRGTACNSVVVLNFDGAGTRTRQVRALVEIEVEAGVLEYERSPDDLHVLCILSGDAFEVVEVQAWP
jgi:hypothetical protein